MEVKMISYIKGEVTDIYEDRVVVENNDIGYNIFVPMSLISELRTNGEEIKIYTYLNVKEDAMQLYGFLTKDDLHVFKLLLSVNGIGPKGALGVLSAISPDNLRFAVMAGDIKAITKAPGIGAKTAQRLIIELKDKLNIDEMIGSKDIKAEYNGNESLKTDTVQALAALGYSATESMKAVNQVTITENMTVEEILKEALKKISFL